MLVALVSMLAYAQEGEADAAMSDETYAAYTQAALAHVREQVRASGTDASVALTHLRDHMEEWRTQPPGTIAPPPPHTAIIPTSSGSLNITGSGPELSPATLVVSSASAPAVQLAVNGTLVPVPAGRQAITGSFPTAFHADPNVPLEISTLRSGDVLTVLLLTPDPGSTPEQIRYDVTGVCTWVANEWDTFQCLPGVPTAP